MAQDYSFDVVSDFDHQEMVNAVDQTKREVGSRYDFKNLTADIELEKDSITVTTAADMQMRAIKDILQSKLHKRGIDIKVLDPQKVEDAAKGNIRQVFKLKRGIGDDLGRKLSKKIRDEYPKAQVRIQGDQLRISARDKDLLQDVMKSLRESDLDVALQFTNYR